MSDNDRFRRSGKLIDYVNQQPISQFDLVQLSGEPIKMDTIFPFHPRPLGLQEQTHVVFTHDIIAAAGKKQGNSVSRNVFALTGITISQTVIVLS